MSNNTNEESIRYPAGVTTAYGAAKRGGYTGTFEEFCEALCRLADVLEDLGGLSANARTLPAGESAEASYADGVLTFGIPKGDTGAKGDKGDTGEKGDKGDTGATGNGITSIELTTTQGSVKTYTITFTDGTTTTFDVRDGEVSAAQLAAETAAREEADSNLKNALNNEITTRTNSDATFDEDLNNVIDNMAVTTSADLTPAGVTIFLTTKNTWSTSNSPKSLFVEIPTGTDTVVVESNNENIAIIALLKDNSHIFGEAPHYATGAGRETVQANASKTLSVPNDAKYLYITKVRAGVTYTPNQIDFLAFKDIPAIDATLTKSGEGADAKVVGELLLKAEDIDLTLNIYRAYITKNNIWTTASGRSCNIVPIPNNAISITVDANASNGSNVAFLRTNAHVSGETPDFADGTGKNPISAGTTASFAVPSDANYLYITGVFDGVDYAPVNVSFLESRVSESETTIIPLGLHEMPETQTALNIVKRCRQMTDIKWTPAVDLKRFMLVWRNGEIPETAEPQNYLGTFKAGVEYKGIPYGRVSTTMTDYGYQYATAGHYIDFETFVSAVSNAESIVSKRNVASVSGHRSAVYASVCSGLTCYALNVSEVPTASIAGISGLNVIGKINDNGVELADDKFKIGDVLNKYDYHTAIITDIIRDELGIIQVVELSDASTAGLADKNYSDGQLGGVCRRKGWSREQLFDPNSWGAYTLYRYSGAVPYTPSAYVNVGDEFDRVRVEHFPVMPYEGNAFIYKTGYIPNNAIKLLIALDGYAYLRVFKNGTEITGSPFAVAEGTKNIDVTEISAGEYEAYLCNMADGNVTNLTYRCKWSVT